MTQDEIMEIAKQAGIDDWWDSGNEQREVLQEHLEAFAKLVAAKEREVCALVCEDLSFTPEGPTDLAKFQRKLCAKAIRARGEG